MWNDRLSTLSQALSIWTLKIHCKFSARRECNDLFMFVYVVFFFLCILV